MVETLLVTLDLCYSDAVTIQRERSSSSDDIPLATVGVVFAHRCPETLTAITINFAVCCVPRWRQTRLSEGLKNKRTENGKWVAWKKKGKTLKYKSRTIQQFPNSSDVKSKWDERNVLVQWKGTCTLVVVRPNAPVWVAQGFIISKKEEKKATFKKKIKN